MCNLSSAEDAGRLQRDMGVMVPGIVERVEIAPVLPHSIVVVFVGVKTRACMNASAMILAAQWSGSSSSSTSLVVSLGDIARKATSCHLSYMKPQVLVQLRLQVSGFAGFLS